MADLISGPEAPEPQPASGPAERRIRLETLAAELRRDGLIDAALTECVPLSGGTASVVAALARPGAAPELVLKVNEPAQVAAEALFLRTYGAAPLLPRLRVVDPTRRLLVYDYAHGVHVRYGRDRVDTRAAMLALVRELLARYVPADAQAQRRGAGTLSDFIAEAGEAGRAAGEAPPAPTAWPDFLGEHVSYRHERLADHLPRGDLTLAERVARAPERAESAPLYLIHGDCGAHNFLFRPPTSGAAGAAELGPLSAVLDPYPIVGYPIYDLAFAFVSWPNGLEPEAILPAAEALRDAGRWQPNGEPRRALWEEVLVALYMRMGTCLAHHPKDFPAYAAAWPRWRALAT